MESQDQSAHELDDVDAGYRRPCCYDGCYHGRCLRNDGVDRPLEEPLFGVLPCVAELWNTVSNVPFIVIGVLRLMLYPDMPSMWRILYGLFIAAGVCSGCHHASKRYWRKFTIVLDWLPIAISIILLLSTGDGRLILIRATWLSWLKFAFALAVLISDHLCLPIPPPWGHSFWHILVSLAIDDIYADSLRFYKI